MAFSQGFDYIMQEEEFDPEDNDIERKQYQEDSAFIYDAFQNSWADSMNFYLVEQNKKDKNGRKVYQDAKNYFRGAAVKDAILMENMDMLINYKLTHTAPNGAESYNNKFNDIVNLLKQQGHVLEPTVLKRIILGNIKDKVYEHLKDQAAASETTTLADVKAQILRKYLSMQGERRIGAPAYTQKRFVNTALSKHVRFHSDDENGNSPGNSDDNETGDDADDQARDIYATKSKRPHPSLTSPTWPSLTWRRRYLMRYLRM